MSQKEEQENLQIMQCPNENSATDATLEPECKSRFDLSSKARKRLWAAAMLLCVVAIVAGVYLTYTAFLAGGFLKAVAVNGSSQVLFGSDMLIGYTTEKTDDQIDGRSVVVDASGNECNFSFKLYNYLPGDKNKVNDKEVNVCLTIKAQNASNGWSVTQQVNGGSSQSVTQQVRDGVNLEFKANHATDYTYKVTFSEDDLKNNVVFTIKATVLGNSPGTNLKMLAVRVAPSQQATVTPAGVTGAGVGNVESLDAYGYRVTVTGAKTRVTIKWGEDVELDPHFETNHAGATVDRSERTATFDMDPGSQMINFYQAPGKERPSSWGGVVTSCTGRTVESTTTTG